MEPETGASTWALGSHKWTEYKGVFTRNGKMVKNHHKVMYFLGVIQFGKVVKRCPFIFIIRRRENNSGREVKIIYIIRYVPAWRRSGWYPQPKMRIKVGIREASNII